MTFSAHLWETLACEARSIELQIGAGSRIHIQSLRDHAATDVMRLELAEAEPAVHPEEHGLDDPHQRQHRRRSFPQHLRTIPNTCPWDILQGPGQLRKMKNYYRTSERLYLTSLSGKWCLGASQIHCFHPCAVVFQFTPGNPICPGPCFMKA